SPLVSAHIGVLPPTLRVLAVPRVRNVATLGGHLAQADPHTDLPPILVALGARALVVSTAGERWIDVEKLFVGERRTSLRRSELIRAVFIPDQRDGAAYEKCTTLSASHDWPAVGIAVNFALDGERIAAPRVAVGAAQPTPV